MAMFQATAVLQDLAPATPVAPRGTGFNAGPEKGGGFERVLQERQGTDAEGTAQNEALRAGDKQSSSVTTAAAGQANAGQPVAKTPQKVARNGQAPLRNQEQPEQVNGDVAAAPVEMHVAVGKVSSSSKDEGDSDNQENSATGLDDEKVDPTAALMAGKIAVAVPGGHNGNPILDGKSIAVAQQGAEAVAAAGERAAGATDEIPADGRKGADAAQKPEVDGLGAAKVLDFAAKLQQSEVAAAAREATAIPVVERAQGQEVSQLATQNGEQQGGDALQGAQQKEGVNDAAKTAAASGKVSEGVQAPRQWGILYQAKSRWIDPSDSGKAAEVPAGATVDGKAGAGPQGGAAVEPANTQQAQQPQPASAPTAAQTGGKVELATSGVAPKGAALQQEDLQPAQATQQKGDNAAAVERKDPRGAEHGHRGQGLENLMTEQSTAAKGTEGGAGTKVASATEVAKLVATEAKPGQDGSGNAEGKGQEQNAQAKQEGFGFAPAIGGQTGAADSAPADAKQGGQRTALHDSILAQVKEGVVTHDGKGNGEISIRLSPDDLGELKIQVRMDNNRLNVEVQADNHMVKDLLMSNLDSLKDALAGKNFTMTGFDVSTGGSGGFNSALNGQQQGYRQQPMLRSARSGYGDPEGNEGRVKYLTAEVNNLLDVRF